MIRRNFLCFCLTGILFLASCTKEKDSNNSNTDTTPSVKLFNDISSSTSGLSFNNTIVEDANVNYYKYVYLYNGGGVGIGDINDDDLPEVYFTSTQGKDKLFLNKGGMQFEDISEVAGINKYGGQKTGVTMVDINNDGLLDIYVCRAGWNPNPQERRNLLFINKGKNRFEEEAAKWGINDMGHSTQAAFFDYDKDGDLDLFVGNHPGEFSQPLVGLLKKIQSPDPTRSDKFYKNNGDQTFTDVSIEAGINNYSYSLGIAIGDLNQDGWEDIYVANDFAPHDSYFLNNGNGTFTESLKEYFPHCPYFAMGCDLVDINNDQNLDLFVVEMLSEDNSRQKTNMAPMDMKRFAYMVNEDLHYQYMRNAFQINNGNGHFSDVAYYSGIDKTDWSWGTLFGDYDNDGDDDLVVVNGFLKDTQDKDFSKKSNALSKKTNGRLTFEQASSLLTSTPIQNYAYRNTGDFQFENASRDWGFNFKGFSNGVAHGDLDRDGDLDIIVNNINADASLYENTSKTKNFIAFTLEGPAKNKSGFHTKITLHTPEGIQFKDFQVTRGFQSCVDQIIHFGLKPSAVIEKAVIQWPDGKQQTIQNPAKGQYHNLLHAEATETSQPKNTASNNKAPFKNISNQSSLQFVHEDVYFDDYEREVLLPHKLSQMGPAIATGDIDNNGLTDCYIGGAHQQAGTLWLQKSAGKFTKSSSNTWFTDAAYEDVDALFFDADNDNDLDLYIVSGSNEYDNGNALLQDRYYENDGKGNFSKSKKAIPTMTFSGGCVAANDYDKDGDQDLFVGGRMVPGDYPSSSTSILLENNNGIFKDVTATKAPTLKKPGMITDALWTDFNNDQQTDLILVGEWTDLLFYENKNGQLLKSEQPNGLSPHVGWWNSIKASDLDGDGDLDYVVGNLGVNYKYQASDERPFEIYSHDFDDNGQRDIVVGYYAGDELYPVRGLQCSSEQIPDLKKKFPTYESFGKANIKDIYGDKLDEALHYSANDFSSLVLWNDGNGVFSAMPLPKAAQMAPIQDIVFQDLNSDEKMDIIVAGNWFMAEIETPRADNGTGLVLMNQGDRQFQAMSVMESGLFANKDVRGLAWLDCGKSKDPLLVVANSNSAAQVFQFTKEE